MTIESIHSSTPRLSPAPPQNPPLSHSQPPMVYVYEKQPWEYKILLRKANEELPSEQELNDLGASGWELVGVVALSDSVQFYLKRARK